MKTVRVHHAGKRTCKVLLTHYSGVRTSPNEIEQYFPFKFVNFPLHEVRDVTIPGHKKYRRNKDLFVLQRSWNRHCTHRGIPLQGANHESCPRPSKESRRSSRRPESTRCVNVQFNLLFGDQCRMLRSDSNQLQITFTRSIRR